MGQAVTVPAGSDALASRAARRRLVLASVVLGAWLAFLAHQVYWHANPVVVSVPQVLVAPLIVEGELRERPLRVLVERVWRGDVGLVGRELNLEGGMPPNTFGGGRYVLPLRPAGAGYRPEPVGGDGPVIYPADAHVRRQLERIIQPPSQAK